MTVLVGNYNAQIEKEYYISDVEGKNITHNKTNENDNVLGL